MNEQGPETPRDDDLQQLLWEFVYDLLPPEQADEVIQRISSDPQVARLYAEVKLRTDIVRDAMRHDQPPVPLGKPKDVAPASAAQRPAAKRSAFGWGNALSAALAASLLLIVGFNLVRTSSPRPVASLAKPPIRTTVVLPAAQSPEAPTLVGVMTRDMAGQPVSAPVLAEVLGPQNEVVWSDQAQTTDDGTLQLRIPTTFVAAQNSLRLKPADSRAEEAVTANFRVREPVAATHLLTDRPVYAPGETTNYRSLTMPKLAAGKQPELAVEFQIRDPDGNALVQQSSATQFGVAAGSFELAENAPEGLYAIVARNAEGRFREVSRQFAVSRVRDKQLDINVAFAEPTYEPGQEVVADVGINSLDGTPVAGADLAVEAWVDEQPLDVVEGQVNTNADGTAQVRFQLPNELDRGEGLLRIVARQTAPQLAEQAIVRKIPVEVPVAEVSLFPEGGQLVPGVSNRVYFLAQNRVGQPLAFAGRIVDDEGNEVARLASEAEGRGVCEFVARPGRYRVELDQPAGWTVNAEQLDCQADGFVTLNTGGGVFAAGEPLRFALLSNQSGRGVAIVAAAGGVDVGSMVAVTEGDRQTVELPIAETAQGVVRLTLYDADVRPPRPLAERLVYRRPAGSLNVTVNPQSVVAGDQDWTLHLADVEGRPVDGSLGMAVVGGDASRRWREHELPDPNTSILLLDPLDHPADLENADLYVAESPISERALDLLLGVRGWRRVEPAVEPMFAGAAIDPTAGFADQSVALFEPPQLLDNLSQVRQRQSIVDEFSHEAETSQTNLARLLIPIAAAVLVVVGVLAVMRLARAWTWVPALGVATATLVLGLIWITESGSSGSARTASQLAKNSESAVEMRGSAAPARAADKRPATPKKAELADMAPADSEGAASMPLGREAAVPALTESAPKEVPPPPAPMDESGSTLRKLASGTEPSIAMADDVELEMEMAQASPDSPPETPRPLERSNESIVRRQNATRNAFAPETGRARRSVNEPLEAASRLAGRDGVREEKQFNENAEGDREPPGAPVPVPALNVPSSQPRPAIADDDRDRRGDPAEFFAQEVPIYSVEGAFGRELAFPPTFRRFYFQPMTSATAEQNAPITLLWDPLQTAVNGQVRARFHIPANLDSVQLLAVAHDGTRTGMLHRNIPVGKPITIRTPELASMSVGDVFQLPLAITNYSSAPMMLDLTYETSPNTAPVSGDARSLQLQVEGNSTVTHWLPPVEAREVGPAVVRVTSNTPTAPVDHSFQTEVVPLAPSIYWQQSAIASAGQPESVPVPRVTDEAIGKFVLRGYPSLASELRDAVLALSQQVPPSDPRLADAAESVQEWFAAAQVADPELTSQLREWRKPIIAAPRAARLDSDALGTVRTESFESGGMLGGQANAPQALDDSLAALGVTDAEALGDERRLAESLLMRQQPDGSVEDLGELPAGELRSRSSVVPSAIAALAFRFEHEANAQRARGYLRSQRRGGGDFGAPEATSLTLQALAEDPERPAVAPNDVSVQVRGADQVLGGIAVPEGSSQAIEWRQWHTIADIPTPELQLEVDGVDQLPYVFAATLFDHPDPSQFENEIAIESRLSAASVTAGQDATLTISVERKQARDVRVVVAPPGGAEIDQRQLVEQFVGRGIETTWWEGSRLVIDWPAASDEASGETHTASDVNRLEITMPIRCVAPGQYQVVPATAYFLDTPAKWAVAPRMALEITAPD